LIEGLDASVQERLAAIYGAIKKNAYTSFRFLERGRAIVSVDMPDGSSVDVLFIGVDFKAAKDSPTRGTLTLLWKRMLTRID